MATNRRPTVNGLRSTNLELQSARQQFITSIESKQKFNEECAVIIPALQKHWVDKVLTPFNLPYTEHIEAGTVVVSNGIGPGPLLQTQEGVNHINWRHYLYNYDPFLLQKAISRLSSRMKIVADGTVENTRGPIANVPAYFKALVQDLRVADIHKRKSRDLDKMAEVECEECFDECGSRACLRPAHLRAKAGL